MLRGGNLGYVHDFCNWRVTENKTDFVIFAHNFFGFDMFFFVERFSSYRLGHERY